MCGIIGIIGIEKGIGDRLLKCIKRLEYRGYDSLGMVTMTPDFTDLRKDIGNIEKVNQKLRFSEMKGSLGICHTRWATCGGITKENSHPHFNQDKTIFAVHNGIIENYEELKTKLESHGYEFKTETDSEIIPHYFDSKLKSGIKIKQAILDFMNDIKGSFAILLIIKGQEKIYALKRDSPLVLGTGNNFNILASDIYGFNTISSRTIFFDDNEFAVIEKNNYQFYDLRGEKIIKETKTIKIPGEEKTKKDYPHFMIKEIEEQPFCAKRLISSFKTGQAGELNKFAELLKTKKKIAFIACGTSYHASLVGVSFLKHAGIHAQSIVASEWNHFIEADEDTFVIAISQSGETMDVVVQLKEARKKGATIGAIVNVPYSTIQRISDISLNILAGQEVAVASTKAFTNTNILLLQLAKMLGVNFNIDQIPGKLKKTLNLRGRCREIAGELRNKKDIYILGRHFSYPIAREIALKIKEVDYIHAEGMMAGELKHGTLALIEKGVPVFCLVPGNCPHILSGAREVKARGAKIYLIGNDKKSDLRIPDCNDLDFPIYSALVGHLLSYELGVLLGVEIDQCRNLAKSVTVL